MKRQPTSTPTDGGTRPLRIRLAGGTGPALPLLSVKAADGRRLVTKLALVTGGLVVLGAAITAVRPDAGTSPAERETVPVKRKPNKAVLAALAVAHVGVTALTWRDLRYRPAEQVRGNKTFWRVASTLNMGNSAVYWLFGRRAAGRR